MTTISMLKYLIQLMNPPSPQYFNTSVKDVSTQNNNHPSLLLLRETRTHQYQQVRNLETLQRIRHSLPHHLLCLDLLTQEKIPCQQGEDSLLTSPKLDSLSFVITISNRIMAPLPYAKWFFFIKEDLIALRIEA